MYYSPRVGIIGSSSGSVRSIYLTNCIKSEAIEVAVVEALDLTWGQSFRYIREVSNE